MLTVRVAVDIMVPLHAIVELSKRTMPGLSTIYETALSATYDDGLRNDDEN